jgi:CelD/BcsL family acetyltransferase involved in cellulose biosynthesis
MKIELVTRREDLPGLAQRWDELAQADARDSFFRTSGWYRSWMEHVRPDAEPFVAVARDAGGRILGLAPLCRMRYRDRWLPIESVALAGREVVSGDFLDYLAEPGARQQVLSGLLDFLWEARSEWGLLIAGELTEDGDLHRLIEAFARERNLPIRAQEERTCPYIELPSTFDEYLACFSKKRRHELRRQMRVVLEKSDARRQVLADPAQVTENLDVLIRLHGASWRRANQSGNMGREGFVNFLKEVCRHPPAGAEPRLYLLRHEEKPVAALLIFYSGQSALLYSMGWDPESAISQLSPGIVLIAESIRDAIANGMRYYDFLRGDESYKRHLTKSARKTITLLVGRSANARLYLQALRAKDAFKNRFPEWWGRVSGVPADRPERIKPGAAEALPLEDEKATV